MSINPHITFNPLVKYNKNTNLCLDISSYSISYGGNFEIPGYKYVIAHGLNYYFGEIKKQIELYVAISDDATTVELEKDSFTYTGYIIKPDVSVYVNDKRINLSYKNYLAYQIKYDSNCKDVGYYQLSVKSNNELGGCVIKQFEIVLADVNSPSITIDYDEDVDGNGELIWPNINVSYNNNELSQNVDYTISNTASYENIIPGNASITLLGKGNFTGDIRLEYGIYGNMEDCQLSCLLSDWVEYTGNEIKYQKNNFKLTWFNIDLPSIHNIRYITDNYICPGEKRLEIYLSDEHWRNQLSYTYSIVADIETDCTFEGYDSLYYSKGEEIKPNVVVKLINSSYTLIEGTDYDIEYDSNVDYSIAGTKTIIIRGKNESGYINSKTISYSVYDDSSSIAYYVNHQYPVIYQITTLNRLNVNVDNLYKFVAGSAITSIDNAMFKNCTTLALADFSKCSAEMPESMFENCENLQYVFIINQNIDEYLCFTAELANSTIKLHAERNAPRVYLETSLTNDILEGWSDFIVGETTITLPNVGDKIYFRAKRNNNTFAINDFDRNKFIMTGKIAASGNLNALLKVNSSIIDLSGKDYCYCGMFSGCKSLTKAPELPATTLALSCYDSMFYGCTSLTKAPELPATTLASDCYHNMFRGCTALTQAPELPATSLARYCYCNMFSGCTSLTQAPALPATTLSDFCYYYMFSGCKSLTKAPELPATTLADYCYYSMFQGCTSLTQAPELPATSLAHYQCYCNMFNGCTNLNNINVNFSGWYYYYNVTINWVSGVSSSGTFICPEALPQEFGSNYIPLDWNVVYKNNN